MRVLASVMRQAAAIFAASILANEVSVFDAKGQVLPVGDVRIEILYADQGIVHWFLLTATSYQSNYTLTFFESVHPRAKSKVRPVIESINVPGSTGRLLVESFQGLQLSWDVTDYWFRAPPEFEAVPDEFLSCGLLRAPNHRLIACPISPIASGRQSPEANKLAWFVQLLNLTREQLREAKQPMSLASVKDQLVQIAADVPEALAVPAAHVVDGGRKQVSVGLILRSTIALAVGPTDGAVP
jgi:hypothetical protein